MTLRLVSISFLVCLILASSASAVHGAGCRFILGFQALHDLAPIEIGNCLDSQAFAANGDAQQHTTNGLLVWRKADNWTAFTNGYRTWINGPNGIVTRLNTQRFNWEANHDALAVVEWGQAAQSGVSVRQPQPFDLVDLPVAVSGIGTGFEGVFQARLRDGTGKELIRQTIHAGGTGILGNYSAMLKPLVAPATADGTVEVFEPSPKGDGTEVNKVIVPVTFGPVLLSPYHGFALYTVAAGDTIALLAQHWYGDANDTNKIRVANRDHTVADGTIHPGQQLRIPQ